jgi:hypothetical protein
MNILDHNLVDGKQLHTCEKCGKDKVHGKEKDQATFYEFHYGTKRDSKTGLYSGPVVPSIGIKTTTTYRIHSDTAKVFLCHDCVLDEYLSWHPTWSLRESWISYLIYILVFGVLFGVSLLLANSHTGTNASWGVACGGITLVLFPIFIFYAIKDSIKGYRVYQELQQYKKYGPNAIGWMSSTDWQISGDRLAIEIRKKEFEEKGYDGFFTRNQYFLLEPVSS